MKKTISLVLVMLIIISLGAVAFADDSTDVLNKTERFDKPEFVEKIETLGLSIVDWVIGLSLIGALLGFVFASSAEYLGGLDQQKAKVWKSKLGFIFKILFVVFFAKNIIEYLMGILI